MTVSWISQLVEWSPAMLAGASITLGLAIATLPPGLALGLALAMSKASDTRLVRAFGEGVTTVFRGVPELLTLFLVYFGGQYLLSDLYSALEGGQPPEISRFAAGVVALSLVFAAYSSEVLFSAMLGIHGGQGEAAEALGLGRFQTFRFVVFPQLIRLALPGLANNWLSLVKDTSLVSVIALPDLMRQTTSAVGVTKAPFVMFGAACVVYLVISAASSLLIGAYSSSLNRGFAHGS